MKLNILYPVIFITGGSVLILEVLGIRILSPYFGNTLFTFSSVLSVILAALSVGYYTGGVLADKRGTPSLFYQLILASGILVLFLYRLTSGWLETFGYSVSIVSGPLIGSLIFFFAPALLLGMLSPLAIKILSRSAGAEQIGHVSGSVFFWSTVGSITGSLASGFWLVPTFGISTIMYSVGGLLTGIGALGYLLTRSRVGTFIWVAVFFSAGLIIVAQKPSESLFPISIRYQEDGVYERLRIYDTFYNGRSTRFFEQDRSNSAAMYLDSDELVFDYTKYFSLYKALKPDAKRSLVIGGGAYSIPKALLVSDPLIRVDVAEIEPRLSDLAEQYFNLKPDPRLRNFTTDGRRFLALTEEPYDLIFSDVYYSLYALPTHFTTREFFELALSRLTDKGVFMANVIGTLDTDGASFLLSELKTFQDIFLHSYIFAVESPNNLGYQNFIFVGHKSDSAVSWTEKAITGHAEPVIAKAHQHLVDTSALDLADRRTLTDNYAPVDYLVAQGLKNKLEGRR